MKKLILCIIATFTYALGFAIGLDDLTYIGSGPNRAALVIDFKNGGPAYAWGYRFSGTVTGQTMITDIAAADPFLDIQITSYSFGDAITGIRFGGNNEQGFDAGSQGYWGYWLAELSQNQPSSWTSSPVGMGGRTVADQSWDAWSWAPNFNDTPPTSNIIAVPEPISMLGLGLGFAALLTRRKSRK